MYKGVVVVVFLSYNRKKIKKRENNKTIQVEHYKIFKNKPQMWRFDVMTVH